MDAESILTIMKMTQPLATVEHAVAMAEYGRSRGLTPFAEFYPIFAEQKEKQGQTWVVIGLKGLTFKEHYSVQGRWSQKSGGYSTPVNITEAATEIDRYNKTIPGIRARVGIITNRDYAALAQMALARIPGWNYKEEREAFVHYGEAFVANTHRPPSGWTVEGVARKRATEQALKLAFGKEPTQAGNIYAVSMDERRPRLELEDARGLLYPERKSRPALEVVDVDPEPPTIEGEWSDEADAANVAALQAEADAGEPGTPATTGATIPADCPVDTWENFLKFAVAHFGFKHNMEAVNTLKKHLGGDDDPDWTPWNGARLNGDAESFWRALAEHANKQA